MTRTEAVIDPENRNDVGTGFGNKDVRRNFVKKVYSILATQLFVSIAIGAVLLSIPELRNYFAVNRFWAFLASLVSLIPMFILACCPQTGRNYPTNYILLGTITIFQGFAIGVISCVYKTELILMALGSTAICVIVISVVSIAMPFDITECGCVLLILTLVHLVLGLIGSIIIYMFFGSEARMFFFVLSMLGAFLFSLWLAYDTQMIVGGRKYELSPEDYVFGALALYIDIIHIFLNILQIFGTLDR